MSERQPPSGARPARKRRTVVAGTAAVALVAAGATWQAQRGPDEEPYRPHPASVQKLSLPGAPTAPAPGGTAPSPRPAPAAPAAAGRDATAAARAYLDARVRGNAAASFAMLTPAQQAAFGTVEDWTLALSDRPRITGYTVGRAVAAPGGAVDVAVDVVQQPGLDSRLGFVPGRLRGSFRAEPSAAGWRVQPDPVSAEAILPADAGAATAASAWLTSKQRCDDVSAARLQASAGLVGASGYADLPCRTPGNWRAGAVGPLVEGPRTQPVLAAYGSGASGWSRLVSVSGPEGATFSVALAPIGDQWRVYGLVSDGSGRSEVGSPR